jgi:hypothetical protein
MSLSWVERSFDGLRWVLRWVGMNLGLDEFELKGEMSLRGRDEVMLG